MSKIGTPFRIGNIVIKNRLVFPPVFCFGFKNDQYILSDEHIEHYEKRARGGAGLIIVEAIAISDDARILDAGAGLWNDDQIAGFAKLKQMCNKYSTKVILQLNFAGIAGRANSSTKFSPSESMLRNTKGVVMTQDDIKRVQDAFVSAALRAKQAGVDGVELHGAHGYLISRFFDTETNKRTDEYGGSVENRARFATEILSRIRKQVGQDFILSCRMGSNIPNVDGAVEIAKLLKQAGANLIDISTGIGMPTDDIPDGFPCNNIVYNGTQMKDKLNVPVIVVNCISTPDQCNYLVDNNMADLVACGRAMLADEDFANSVIDKQEYIPCLHCKKCYWFRGEPQNCPGQIRKNK